MLPQSALRTHVSEPHPVTFRSVSLRKRGEAATENSQAHGGRGEGSKGGTCCHPEPGAQAAQAALTLHCHRGRTTCPSSPPPSLTLSFAKSNWDPAGNAASHPWGVREEDQKVVPTRPLRGLPRPEHRNSCRALSDCPEPVAGLLPHQELRLLS